MGMKEWGNSPPEGGETIIEGKSPKPQQVGDIASAPKSMVIHFAKFFARKKSGQNVLITFERILAQGKRFGLFFLVGGRVAHFSPRPQKWKVHGASAHKRRIDLAGKNATRLTTEPSRPELHVARREGVHLPGNDQH